MLITRKYIGIAIVALLAVVGSALSVLTLSAQDPPVPTQEPLATVVARLAAAEDAKVTYCDPRTDGITVQGSGVVTLPANIGVVELGVDVIAETVSEARSNAASSMQAIIDAVNELGVEDDDITTTRINIWPETTWVEEEIDLGEGITGHKNRQIITGYRVSNRVRIEIDVTEASDDATDADANGDESDDMEDEDRDILSAVIDAAATAGGDHVRIDSISFRANQTSESVDEARKLAVTDALHRANLYAEAFGVEVGTLLSASESVASRPVFDDFSLAKVVVESAASDGPSTPVSAGDVEIRASITAKFAIDQPGCIDKKTELIEKDADGDTE